MSQNKALITSGSRQIKRRLRSKSFRKKHILIRCLLILYAVVVIFPLAWTAMTSLKTNQEFFMDPWGLPSTLQWGNYVTAWVEVKVSDYFFNSVIVTALCILLTGFLAATSAYVLGRYQFKGRKAITTVYLSGIMVPGVLTIIPTFFLLKDLFILDSLVGLTMVYVSRTLPFSLMVLIGFFKTLPHEMEEAAYIDGCGHVRCFLNIMLPMAMPGIVTITIFNFIWYWNEFLLALTFVTTNAKKTLPLGLVMLLDMAQYRTDWGALFAGLMIIMLPTILFYILFEDKIEEGLTAGAVKG